MRHPGFLGWALDLQITQSAGRLLSSGFVLVDDPIVFLLGASSFLLLRFFSASSGLTFLIASSVKACLDSRLITSFFRVIRSPTDIVTPAAILQVIDRQRMTAVTAGGLVLYEMPQVTAPSVIWRQECKSSKITTVISRGILKAVCVTVA